MCEQADHIDPGGFKFITRLGSQLVSRHPTLCISHTEALEQAHGLAMHWLHPDDQPVDALLGDDSKLSPIVNHLLQSL